MDVRDKAELQRVGEVGAKAMGGGYKVGPAAQVNYEASGASDDWAKGAAGIKYSFTVELPDTGRWVPHCTHCTHCTRVTRVCPGTTSCCRRAGSRAR